MATEKRLIDANALELEPDPWGGMNGVLITGRSGGKMMAIVQAALNRMIDDAPTVDAVEVVRCKDCVFYKETEDWDGSKYFACHKRAAVLIMQMKPDDFCSYGERRARE